MKYYSQFGEDKHLHENYFHLTEKGTFLELGAMDGVLYSNTKTLEDRGWTGYLIEPDPVSFSKLPKNRPNSKCFNVAIAQERGKIDMRMGNKIHAVTAVDDGMAKGFRDKWHKNSQTISVDCCPISDLIKFEEVPRLNFWSLDVEGREFDVLSTFDWRIHVDFLLMETLDHFYKETNDKCRELLKSKGYIFREKIHLNELWIKAPH